MNSGKLAWTRRRWLGGLLALGGSAAVAILYEGWARRAAPDLSGLSQKRELIESLAETIIPTTDSPGAREAGIVDPMLLLIRECTSPQAQANFMEGLGHIERYAHWRYGKSFASCAATEQVNLLAPFSKYEYVRKLERRVKFNQGDSFFHTLRRTAGIAYCTSQAGATRGLAYDYVPGAYRGCVLLRPGQRAWSLK